MTTWATCPFTKGEVNRAGKVLVDPLATSEQKHVAMGVMSNWRASHAYPMHALLMMLRNKAPEVDASAIVVQRHKRAPSIIEKLTRYTDMELSRMQDIGGCRAILSSVEDVEQLSQRIQTSRIRHKLHREYNYIETPKPDGYRGIHLVYKYNGEKTEYNSYFVELQLRSKIQHAWSTAVEIVDTFTGQSLKSGTGTAKWKKFFLVASAEFAKLENRPIGAHIGKMNTNEELKKLTTSMRMHHLLSTFAAMALHLNQLAKIDRKRYEYFLLELNHVNKSVNVTTFRTADLKDASELYLEKENEFKDNPDNDVVLVAASSIDALRHAYPNYFADSTEFLQYIDIAINS